MLAIFRNDYIKLLALYSWFLCFTEQKSYYTYFLSFLLLCLTFRLESTYHLNAWYVALFLHTERGSHAFQGSKQDEQHLCLSNVVGKFWMSPYSLQLLPHKPEPKHSFRISASNRIWTYMCISLKCIKKIKYNKNLLLLNIKLN